MKENFIENLRIITIENNGDITAIFSANDCTSKNTINLFESDNIEKIMQYYSFYYFSSVMQEPLCSLNQSST